MKEFKKDPAAIKKLSPEQYRVTQQSGTERPGTGKYLDNKEPGIYVLEHGYCRSLYCTDPDGMICEFTVDHPDVAKINALQRGRAHAELKRWLAGDHTSNNMFR